MFENGSVAQYNILKRFDSIDISTLSKNVIIELMCMPYRRQAILEALIFKLMIEMQSKELDSAFFTSEFIIKFFLALDLKLPGNAHNFSTSFAFDAFKSILDRKSVV